MPIASSFAATVVRRLSGPRGRPRRRGSTASGRAVRGASLLAVLAAVQASPDTAALASAHAVRSAAPDLVDVVRRVDRGLVHVEVPDGVGSAFVYRDPSTVITAAHVVEGVPVGGAVLLRAVVEAPDRITDLGGPITGTLRFVHADLDLAVIEVPEPPASFRPLEPAPILPGTWLPRGSDVLIHGFPGPMSPTLSRGLVAGHLRDFAEGATFYLLDGATGAGSSGGPVTDLEGRLVAIMTAVYVEGDGTSFNWAYALPLASIDGLFPESGGASSIAAPPGVAELLERVREAGGGLPRVTAVGEALAEILRTRNAIDALVADLDVFLTGIEPLVELSTPDATGRFVATMLRLARATSIRGAQLGLRDAGYEHEPGMTPEVLAERGAAWADAVMRRALANRPAGSIAEYERAVLLPWVDAMDRAIVEVDRACAVLDDFTASSDLDLRTLDRTAVVNALGRVSHLAWLVEATATLPRADAAAEWAVPPARRATYERLAEAIERLDAAWSGLPATCRRAVAPELDATEWTSAAAVREDLAAQGFRRLDDATEEVAVGPGGTIERLMTVYAGENGGLLYILGESADGGDVDFVLHDPGGAVHDADDALDGFPIVAIDADRPGTWRLELVNVESRTVRVRIERWAE